MSVQVAGTVLRGARRYPINAFKSAYADALANRRDSSLIVCTDSNGCGWGAIAADAAGGQPYSWPAVLSGLVPGLSNKSWFSDGNLTLSGRLAQDTRLTGFTNFSVGATLAFGRWLVTEASPNTDSATFTETGDTADIYDAQSGSSATWSWKVDGGSATNAGGTGTNAFRKTTVSLGSLASHALAVQRVSGGSFFLDGMVFRNSAQREISVMNIAQSSAQISDFIATSNAWSTLPAIQTIRPAAGIISLWTNGVTNGAALDTFISQHQTLIDTFKSVDADVILMSGPAISTAVVSDAVQLQYIEAYNYLAHRNRLRVYHPRYKFGNYSAANNAGIMRDDRHLIAAGDTAFAADLVPLLLS